LDRSYGNLSGLLDLYWRSDPDPQAFAHLALSRSPDITRAFLAYSLEHDLWDPSSLLAQDIAAQATANDLPSLFRYLDQALLRDHLQSPAVGVWNTLAQRGLVPAHTIDPSLPEVTNPRFANPSGHAFDWHLAADRNAQIAIANGALQVSLSGDQPEFLILAWQYVPVRQGAVCNASIESRELTAGIFHYAADGRWLEINGAPAPSTMDRLAIYYRRKSGTTRSSGPAAARNPTLECRP
jgi:hypothetical protein